LSTKNKSAILFNAHKLMPEQFIVAEDGRTRHHRGVCRRNLFVEMASFADKDGRGVCASANTLAKRLGFSRRTIWRYLGDLLLMGWIRNRGTKSKYQGTTTWDLFLFPTPPTVPSTPDSSDSTVPSTSATVPSTEPTVPSTKAKVTYMAHYLPLTCPPIPAHQPSAVGADLKDAVKWVQDAFESKTGKVLLAEDAQSLFIHRLPEPVKASVGRWLSERYGDWMHSPALLLKKEFADYYNPGSRLTQTDEYSKEQLATIRATIDQQIEETRIKNDQVLEAMHKKEESELANIDAWLPKEV
jgi:hypothetical protein